MRKLFKLFVYGFALIGFLLVVGYLAVRFGLTNTPGIIDRQSDYFQKQTWNTDSEWQTFKAAVLRDKATIEKAARDSGTPARLIFALLAVEQLRLYHTDRALFKQAFEPLKLLGNQSQFSWGVMGIKQETAIEIERHLKEPLSPFYLGEPFEDLLNFKTGDPNQERFGRIIDENDRYYSYLYAGLHAAQFMKQWERAGFAIEDRPEIIATLFNIGFKNSAPKADPEAGGAAIQIGGTVYSFGGLAAAVYYSDELLGEFPR